MELHVGDGFLCDAEQCRLDGRTQIVQLTSDLYLDARTGCSFGSRQVLDVCDTAGDRRVGGSVGAAERRDHRAHLRKAECPIAPYDVGLNGSDNPPGGEHTAAYSEEVAADCYAANATRFRAATAATVAALVLLAFAIVSGWRRTAAHLAA